jgi:hypothetical protein
MTLVPAGTATRVPLGPAFLVVALGALVLALRAPLAVTVLGLVAFGVVHNVLELRYVTGRYAVVLRGRLLWTLIALVTGVLLCRLAAARTPEIVLGYLVLAAGVWFAVRRTGWRLAGLAVLAGAMATSLHWPAYHFVILAHLHNVVPLFFLWDWSRRLAPAGRTGFRLAQLTWVLGVPALIFSGLLDRFIAAGPSTVASFAGPPALIASPVTPPGADIGLRFLVVFAFLQTMHYVVWIGFLPRYAPDATAAFEQRVPWLRGPRPWLLGAGFAAVLAVVFVIDYAHAHLLYASVASYHAYLEFPVLLALIASNGPAGAFGSRAGWEDLGHAPSSTVDTAARRGP